MNSISEMHSGHERENLSLLVMETETPPLAHKLKPDESLLVFLLQLALWWSSWSTIEYIPRMFGYINSDWLHYLLIYVLHIIAGGIIYFVPLCNETTSADLVKIKRFFGVVWMCVGSWGFLDCITEGLGQRFGIPPLVIYIGCLSVSTVLGAFHHFKHRKDYLIDRLH